jgi:hypothetical protein
LMSTPDHRRHFGALGATASDIKVSSGGRELLSGMPEGTVFFANEPIHGAVVALSVTPAPIDRRARDTCGIAPLTGVNPFAGARCGIV